MVGIRRRSCPLPNRFLTGVAVTRDNDAVLKFAQQHPGRWTLHYQPSPDAIQIARQISEDFVCPSGLFLLAEGDTEADVVTTYPLNTIATSTGVLQPKYAKLRTIALEGFGFHDIDGIDVLIETLETLPSGFVKDPFWGLGLNYNLRYLIKTIEQIDGVTDLRLRRGCTTGLPTVSNASYILAAKAFDDARRAGNRIHDKALRIAADEKRAIAHNTLLTPIDGKRFPEAPRAYHKDAIVEAIGDCRTIGAVLSNADRKAVVAVTTTVARSVSQSEPEMLLELNRNIEVVTIEDLVERLKTMLDQNLKESVWQTFFVDNPFILKLAFGLPIISLGGQVSVGGRKFNGSGDKISDFVVKAAASGNLALIEIKTPKTALLEASPYRADIYAPSRELSGAVNQVLDQRYQLQKSITSIKDTSGIWNVESYAIQGLVIAGRTPAGNMQLKSFELFRNGMKSVMVITFDELLCKLEHLLEVLRAQEPCPGPGTARSN